MIRINIKNYQKLRRVYLEKLAESGAAHFDEEDILYSEMPDKKMVSNGKSEATFRMLNNDSAYLSELRQILFYEDDKTISVNRKNLQELLAGPEERPYSLGGRGVDSLLSYYQSINNRFSKLKPNSSDRSVINKIFSYNTFSKSNNKELPYWLMKELDQKTCPYCNMGQLTVIQGTERSYRAAFDHYFPKSKYPYLAISLFNLIPACDTCNSLKSKIENLVYPYEECFDEDGKRCSIRLIPNAGHPEVWRGTCNDFNVEFRSMNIESHLNPFELALEIREKDVQGDDHQKRVFNSIRYLELEKICSDCHKEEIRRLIQKYYVYNLKGIEMILHPHRNLKMHNKQIRDFLEFDCLAEQEWNKSPLNKLKHDLIEQLDQLSEG